MEPSPTWNLQFKLATRTVNEQDIHDIDHYIYRLAVSSYCHLQSNFEVNRVLSLSVYLLHYFINKLLHFRITFQYFINHFLKFPILLKPITFDIKDCLCIHCKFPDISTDSIETTLEQYFNNLKGKTTKTQKFMLLVLEKCFDLQLLHTMILQQQYPHLDSDAIQTFVVSYHTK